MLRLETLLWTYLDKVDLRRLTIEHDSGTLNYQTVDDCLRFCPDEILASVVEDAGWCFNTLIIVVAENKATT